MSDVVPWTMLDDFSPFIIYSEGWLDQSAIHQPNSPALDGYFQRTYHTGHRDGDYLSLSWEGEGISIYGTKRSKWV